MGDLRFDYAVDGMKSCAVDLCDCGNNDGRGPHAYLCPTRRIKKWLDRILTTMPGDADA